eukprot:jgi/Mesvir1/4120/Mv13652-RA.1
MASAIMQLHAKGSQDIATIVNPEITFWKTVYPRHTNFAWDDAIITQSTGTSDYGQLVEFKLPRSGDLVTNCTLLVEMDRLGNWENKFSPYIQDFGRALIDYVELTIGGYQIERITGDMLHIHDITTRPDYQSYVKNMPVQHGGSISFNSNGTVKEQYNNRNKQILYLPLEFSFTRDPGLALPMIALQYHEVRVKVKLSPADKIFTRFQLRTPNPNTSEFNARFTTASTFDQMGLRDTIRSLYLRGIYGDEMSQLIIDTEDLSPVNYVIQNALYTDKLTNLSVASGTGVISFNLAGYAGTFKILPDMVPNAEKYVLGTPTVTANSRSTWVATPPKLSVRLMCRYIYLDDFERRQFAVNTHEYLVTEYQHHQHFVTAGVDQVSIDLKFNHPTKELLFFYRPDEWWGEDPSSYQNYTGYWSFANPNSAFGDGHLFGSANLVLNSQNVYGDGRDPVYFSSLIPAHFHKHAWDDRIYTIPFALDPDSMVEEAARQSMQRSEADVRDAVALCVRGQVEVKVGDTNMRADIVSHKCSMIIEVKEVARWTDAVGQLLVYGHHFPGLTKVIVVFDRDGKDIAEEHIEGMEFHVQGLDMMVCTEQYFHKYRA